MLPAKAARMVCWLEQPDSRYARLPLGIFCVIASFFAFLPVIGVEFLPIGLLLIAQDVPAFRKPVGNGVLKLLDWAERLIEKGKALREQVVGSKS